MRIGALPAAGLYAHTTQALATMAGIRADP
jgi:hypothetical protein